MGLTRFPHGVSSFGIPVYGSGIGPIGIGTGNIYYAVTAKASTDLYYEKLRTNGVADGNIFATVNGAYAATTSNQNDVVCVLPGVHTLSADLTWANSFTHLVGLGGPATESDYSVAGCTITSGASGTASIRTLDITGHRNQFYNVNIEQPQAAATALTACRISSYGNYFKNVHFAGMMTNTQDAGTTSSSLEMYTYSGFSIFEDCIIGTPLWDVRSAINGQILFSNTSGATLPQDILFKGCRIFNSSTTDTNPAVRLTANWAVDRLLEFRDCTFFNFQQNIGIVLTSGVFLDGCGTSHIILLSGSTCQYGWNNWADVHTYIFNATGAANHGTGGTAIVSA